MLYWSTSVPSAKGKNLSRHSATWCIPKIFYLQWARNSQQVLEINYHETSYPQKLFLQLGDPCFYYLQRLVTSIISALGVTYYYLYLQQPSMPLTLLQVGSSSTSRQWTSLCRRPSHWIPSEDLRTASSSLCWTWCVLLEGLPLPLLALVHCCYCWMLLHHCFCILTPPLALLNQHHYPPCSTCMLQEWYAHAPGSARQQGLQSAVRRHKAKTDQFG